MTKFTDFKKAVEQQFAKIKVEAKKEMIINIIADKEADNLKGRSVDELGKCWQSYEDK